MKRFTVSLLALIALVVLTSWGGVCHAAPTVTLSVIWPSTGATIGAATHGCWLRLAFDFGNPVGGTINLTNVELSEASGCPGEPWVTLGTPLSGTGHNPPSAQYKWYDWYINSTWMHNDTYTLSFTYTWSALMQPPSSPINDSKTFISRNLYVMHAKDAVAEAEIGFCLFDATDTENGYDNMEVEVKVGDWYLGTSDDDTLVAVNWHDPETGQIVHTEYDDEVVIASDGTATTTLEWDGATSGQYLAKGAYPYTVTVYQPPTTAGPITHQWHSANVSISGVTVEWQDEDTVEVSWTATETGSLGTETTEVLAISPGLGVEIFDSGDDVPNGTGQKSVELDVDISGAGKNGKWLFLVRAKDDYDTYNIAHADRYAQLKGDKAWRNWPADDDRYNVNYDYDGFAASCQDGPFPDSSSYHATAWGASAGIADVQHFIERWQTSRVICHFDHGDPGYANFAPFQGAQACTYLCDDIPNDVDPQYYYLFRCIDYYKGDIRLAVFHSCGSGVTDTLHGAGNLAEAAARAGTQSALGFSTGVDSGEVAYYWECALWLYLASVDDNDNPPTLQAACAYADELCEEHWPGIDLEDDYHLKPRYCFGSVNWGQTLWPAE